MHRTGSPKRYRCLFGRIGHTEFWNDLRTTSSWKTSNSTKDYSSTISISNHSTRSIWSCITSNGDSDALSVRRPFFSYTTNPGCNQWINNRLCFQEPHFAHLPAEQTYQSNGSKRSNSWVGKDRYQHGSHGHSYSTNRHRSDHKWAMNETLVCLIDLTLFNLYRLAFRYIRLHRLARTKEHQCGAVWRNVLCWLFGWTPGRLPG